MATSRALCVCVCMCVCACVCVCVYVCVTYCLNVLLFLASFTALLSSSLFKRSSSFSFLVAERYLACSCLKSSCSFFRCLYRSSMSTVSNENHGNNSNTKYPYIHIPFLINAHQYIYMCVVMYCCSCTTVLTLYHMHVLLHMINLVLQTSLDNTSEEIQQSYICTCAFAKLASMMQPIRCKTGQ